MIEPPASTHNDAVLHGALDVEQKSCIFAKVAFVNENRAALQNVRISFQNNVDCGLKKRMPRSEQSGLNVGALQSRIWLVKADPLIALQHRVCESRFLAPVSDYIRHKSNLVPACFSGARFAAKPCERLNEKSLNEVRLEFLRLHTLHFFTDGKHLAWVHSVACQRALFQEFFKLFTVKRSVYHFIQAAAHLRVIAIADCLHKQLAKGFVLERDLAQHIEDLPFKGFPLTLKFVEEPWNTMPSRVSLLTRFHRWQTSVWPIR